MKNIIISLLIAYICTTAEFLRSENLAVKAVVFAGFAFLALLGTLKADEIAERWAR